MSEKNASDYSDFVRREFWRIVSSGFTAEEIGEFQVAARSMDGIPIEHRDRYDRYFNAMSDDGA